MSVSDPFKGVSDSQGKNSEVGLAPHNALKMALQTMKERCCKLQTRISRLEEENQKLRVGKIKYSEPIKSETQDFSNLEKKVEELLSNKEFWDKLSKISEDNTSTLQNLANVNNCLKFSQNANKFTTPNKDFVYKAKDESLEEVSLKVLSTIMRGKTGDAQQENQNEISSIEDGEDESESDVESLNISLKEILKNLKRDKDLVRQQQEGMKAALQVFKGLIKDTAPCKNCQKKDEDLRVLENKIVGTEESLRAATDDLFPSRLRNPSVAAAVATELKDRICPLCEQYFHCSTPFDDFNEHVLSHFVEDDTEEESLTGGNFELIT